jgi:drug/metabolite transporter (DMT)-like permease
LASKTRSNRAWVSEAAIRPTQAPLTGIASVVAAAALYSVFDAIAKHLVAAYPAAQIVLFRALFGLVPWAVFVGAGHGLRATVATDQPGFQVLRGALGFAAVLCFVLAYRTMPLSDAVAIAYSSPILVTALSLPLLREPVSPQRWGAVLLGFVGILALTRPGSGLLDSGALWALAGAVLYALTGLVTRHLGAANRPPTTMFYSAVVYIVLGGATMPFVWTTPDGPALVGFVALGIVAGIAQYLLVHAYRLAPAATISPFEYTILAWAVVWSVLVWGHVPSGWSLAGMVIVVTAGVLIARSERRGAASTA